MGRPKDARGNVCGYLGIIQYNKDTVMASEKVYRCAHLCFVSPLSIFTGTDSVPRVGRRLIHGHRGHSRSRRGDGK
jgi:hypothetical protein